MNTKAVFISIYFLAGLICKNTASYVNLTADGYQNVVVNIAESVAISDSINCHDAVRLVQVKLNDSYLNGTNITILLSYDSG